MVALVGLLEVPTVNKAVQQAYMDQIVSSRAIVFMGIVYVTSQMDIAHPVVALEGLLEVPAVNKAVRQAYMEQIVSSRAIALPLTPAIQSEVTAHPVPVSMAGMGRDVNYIYLF